jgi:tetratricopeptide (TPR) repeat protein
VLVADLERRLKAGPQGAPVVAGLEDEPARGPASRAERVFRARADRAAVLHAVGVIRWGRGRHDEARLALDEASVICERLLRGRPSDTLLRATLADTHKTLGIMERDAGRLHQAEARLKAVVESAPGDVGVRLTHARILAELGRGGEARAEIDRALASAPLDAAAYRTAAAVHARLARWDLAAETLVNRLEREPGDHWNWCVAAALQARAGDPGRYRRLCRRMLDRYRDTDDHTTAERTAKYCLLLPLSGAEREDAGRLAERAVAGADESLRPWAGAAKGLADYRGGRYADALADIDQSRPVGGDGAWNYRLMAGCVRALALERLGRYAEARAALDTATEIYRSNMPRDIALDPGGFWPDLLLCELLHGEAEAQILLDPAFPADPFVRTVPE